MSQGQKPNQEDAIFPPLGKASQTSKVFLVCDGMGGHEHGEIASTCVANTIGRITSSVSDCTTSEMQRIFEDALLQTYHKLDELDQSNSAKKMGTTLTFLAICTDGILVAHIGDSRVYQLRPDEGLIFQTRDHSLVNDLIASGELSSTEARTHSQRNVITRAIQPHQEFPAKAAYTIINDIKKGDLFFLCSDGVVEQLDNNDLYSILIQGNSPAEKLTNIQKACETRMTRDNNTMYLIEVSDTNDSDEIVLNPIHKDSYVSPEQAGLSSRIHKYTLIICSFVIAFIVFSLIIFLACSTTNQESTNTLQSSEQIQGTIVKHKR